MVDTAARVLAASLLFASLTGCADGGDPSTPAGDRTVTYSVRGQVVTLPADNGGELRVAHEAIDDFVSASGEVVGMDAMTMSFPLAEGVSAEALSVGDPVLFELEVDWDSDDLARVTRLEALPEGTEIPFRAARPTPAEADG